MHAAIFLLLNANLGLFIYEDFKYRAISWWGLISLFILSCLYSSFHITIREIIYNSMLVLLFLIGQYVLVRLYFMIKDRENAGIINRKIGSGDVFFLLAILPLFSPLQFVYVYIMGLIFALSAYWFTKGADTRPIPLAGFFSIYLIVVLLFSQIAGYVLCSDDRIIELLYSNN